MIGDGRKPSAQTHAQGGGASIESGSHPWSSFDGRRMNASSSSDRVERIRRKAESKGLGRSPVRSISPETTRHFGDVVRPPRNSCLGESPFCCTTQK
ncbi:unnamed protein product [Arabis nemorensis]|uniref:Uncharacterized protein n=1 Tax=Arabis nemorensis TaxID=586526 RepID=A0A565CB02_9BRAS|nr:unnamed protein product [Arabis nemorensis]